MEKMTATRYSSGRAAHALSQGHGDNGQTAIRPPLISAPISPLQFVVDTVEPPNRGENRFGQIGDEQVPFGVEIR